MKRQGAEGKGRVTLKIGCLNVRGCSMLNGKTKIFDMLSLSETKLKVKDECEFGCLGRRMSGVTRRRTKEGVTVRQCAMEWKDVSLRLMWMKVKFGRELWVFVFAYSPGIEG